MRRVTLQNIADRLNLSRSTVCRGLRDHPKTSKATRARIRKACEELGYRPDPVLSEMAANRWDGAKVTRGTVMAYILSPTPNKNVELNLSMAFREQAECMGYGLEVFRREEFRTAAKLESVLRSRGITDVILGPVFDKSHAVAMNWDKFVAIQFLPGLFSVPLHSVVRDHFNVVALAWQKAVERGYQRIGIVLLEHLFPVIDDILRKSGAHACQNYLFPHLPVIPPLLHRTFDGNHVKDFVSWVKANNPDVIIGFGWGHEYFFREAFGHSTPYISLHQNNLTPHQLSGIQDNLDTYVRDAINLLIFCRRSHQWGIPRQRIDHVIEPTWYEGNSLPWKGASK